MGTYKDDVPYFIWMRPGMKPSVWRLSKHFQCTSHNEHWDRYADQRLPLYRGIREKKGWSQTGPDNTGEECGEQMITCQAELPSHCSQSSSFGFWLLAMWAAFQLGLGWAVLSRAVQFWQLGYTSVSGFNVLVPATNCWWLQWLPFSSASWSFWCMCFCDNHLSCPITEMC